jgi:uncharacterized protein YndB with AHSA1/START domain
MKWLFLAVAIVAVIVGVAALVGASLPRDHVARRSLHVRRPPADVWTLVADVAQAPAWRADVRRIERAPDREGRQVWIEHGSNGPMTFEILESVPPHRFVTRMVDSTMFGGTWTFAIEPAADGSTLTVSENGWVANPLFRIMSTYVFGHYATIDAYLANVAKHFQEPSR